MRQIPAIRIIKVMIWHFHDLVKNINRSKHIQLYNKKTCLNYDNSWQSFLHKELFYKMYIE